MKADNDPEAIQYMLNEEMIEPDKKYTKGGTLYGKVDNFVYKNVYIADGISMWRFHKEV